MKNKNQPIFPCDINIVGPFGLTKREYFAAIAMQGLLSNNITSNYNSDHLAHHAIIYADELLKQLEQ